MSNEMSETLRKQLAELNDVQLMIQSEHFQEYIVKPMREYQNALKNAYECESLKELHTIKGRKQGSEQLFQILKVIAEERKTIVNELNASEGA